MSPQQLKQAKVDLEYLRDELRQQRATTDPGLRISLSDLRILDLQTGAIVRFVDVMNAAQREVLEILGIDPDDTNPSIYGRLYRIRILKARREGISTLIAALFFIDTYNNPERNTVIIAHSDDSALEIFALYKRFYEHLPPEKKMRPQRAGADELFWAQTNSRISVATAGSVDVKSGATIHNLHKSEYAKWKGDVPAVDASVNIATQWGNIIEETTARGLNHFYQKWQESERKENRYTPVFLPWFADPRNQTPVLEPLVLTEEEAARKLAYRLTEEQIAWYRLQQSEFKELTPQEFPHSAEEAFVSSGNPYFDQAKLQLWSKVLQGKEYAPLSEVRIPSQYTRLRNAYSRGELKLWEIPKVGFLYIVSGDPAGGVNTDGHRDFCSSDVLNVNTGEQIGHLHGRWTPDEFGMILSELGFWFGTALIGVLSNNHGHAVLTQLLNVAHYPRESGGCRGVYFYEPSELKEQKRPQQHVVRVPGFPESEFTKFWMLDLWGKLLAQEDILLFSKHSVTEHMTYVHLPGGKAGGESGTFDDCVSSAAVMGAMYVLRGLPALRSQTKERKPKIPKTRWRATDVEA